ncbi:MAG TPA: VOC family protein [Verrucomicrobiae bacterium]|nr:VOC family protein [Verrucomicrobiae bacterium]
MSKAQNRPVPGRFGWNELVAVNVPAAKKFYTSVLGWKTKPFGKGLEYTLFLQGKDSIGGVMKNPKPGAPALWIPYIFVKDVDATAAKAKKLRAKICMPPFDIPTVGRIAVLEDPQGAVFGIIKPSM